MPSRASLAALAGALVVASAAGGRAGTPVPAVGGLTELPAPQAPGPNRLQNAGFEQAASAALPGWNVRVDGDLWAIEPTAHEGRAALKLTNPARSPYVPSAEQTLALEPGLYTVEGWVKTQDLGGNSPRSGVRLCIDGRPHIDWWQCTEVARGTADWKRLRQSSIAVSDAGTYRITAGAYGKPDGVAWFDDVSLTQVVTPPLDVYLLYPNFRGLLFDDRSQTVRVALGVARGHERATVRLSLVDESSGAVVGQRTYPAAPSIAAELDGSALKPGAFLLRAELLDAAGAVAYRYPDHRIVKTPAKARKALGFWYDERNVAYLRGKPAFVIGLYTTGGYSQTRSTYAQMNGGWGTDRMAEAPINMLINYHLGQAPIPALTTYMDELSDRGIYYLQTVNFYYEDNPQYKSIEYPAARQGEEALNRWVAKTLGAHPGLAGFYTADERPADMVPKVFRQHRALASAAPGTLTYAVLGDGWERQAPLWRDALDVIGLDPYPITKPAGNNNLAMVGDWTRLGQDAVKHSRPVWMVMQYFPLTSAGGWPSYQDLRTMSWMSIVEGARGLFYWSFGMRGLAWEKDLGKRKEKWNELVRITKEIKALEPVLLAPDAPIVRADGGNTAIRTLGKRMPDGARYLFAYNARGTAVSVRWTLDAPASSVTSLDAGQAPPRHEAASLSDSFGPFEVKRYLIR